MPAAFVSNHRPQPLSRRGRQPLVVRVPARYAAPAPTRSTYRRRRLVAGAFVLSLVGVVGLAATAGRADHGSTTGGMRNYLVQPGDTLWGLASHYRGGLGQADYVDLLVQVNGGAQIEAGELIVLP